jgi:hypothetical protein
MLFKKTEYFDGESSGKIKNEIVIKRKILLHATSNERFFNTTSTPSP